MANASEMMSVLAEPIRQTIFDRLADGPRPVGELAADLPISRPAVSQHLKVLKDARLVIDRRAGNRRIYQVDPSGLEAMRSQLDRFWNQALANFREIVEQDPQEAP